MICGQDLNVIALIGIILLIGNRQKKCDHDDRLCARGSAPDGKPPREAIYQACLLRFRPIMMTHDGGAARRIAARVGHRVGSELRRPLGIAIVGGPARQPGADALHDAGKFS